MTKQQLLFPPAPSRSTFPSFFSGGNFIRSLFLLLLLFLFHLLPAAPLYAQKTNFRNEIQQITKVNFKAADADFRKLYPETLRRLEEVSLPEDAKTQEKNALNDAKSSARVQILRKLSELDHPFARSEFNAMRKDGRILPAHVSQAYRFLMGTAADIQDREVWETLFQDFLRLPKEMRRNGDIACLGQFELKLALEKFHEYLEKAPDLTDKDILQLRIAFLRTFLGNNYTGHKYDYAWAKNEYKNLETLRSEQFPDYKIDKAFHRSFAEHAMSRNDFAFAAEAAEKAGDVRTLLLLGLMNAKDKTEAVGAVDQAIAQWNKRDAKGSAALNVLRFLLQEEGSLSRFDSEFPEWKNSPREKLSVIRDASCLLMDAHCYDLAQTIDKNICKDLFVPVETKYYDVAFVDAAPSSAGAWIASEYYNDWDKMEQRFFPYSDQYLVSEVCDLQHLKGVEHKTLKEEYRTGIHFLADPDGLHIYVRCNDPAMDEVISGKRSAGGLECYFKPSYDAAYHMWFCNDLPETKDPHHVDFKAPTDNYALTYDFLKKDAALTREAAVAHFLIPWEYFLSFLPLDGNAHPYWYYGMQRWCGDSRTLSGHVHELERMLRLRFHFTPEQADTVKRRICSKTFHRYSQLRNDRNRSIMAWSTPLLGDPEFYREKLLPILEDLDKAGNEIEKADSRTLDRLFKEKAPLWHNILRKVDSVRTEYLRQSLLQE